VEPNYETAFTCSGLTDCKYRQRMDAGRSSPEVPARDQQAVVWWTSSSYEDWAPMKKSGANFTCNSHDIVEKWLGL
jgi:hypothetical protein